MNTYNIVWVPVDFQPSKSGVKRLGGYFLDKVFNSESEAKSFVNRLNDETKKSIGNYYVL